jgi:hypothetical protein
MKLAGRLLIVLSLLWLSHSWADEQSLALLKRMNQAASNLDSFVRSKTVRYLSASIPSTATPVR